MLHRLYLYTLNTIPINPNTSSFRQIICNEYDERYTKDDWILIWHTRTTSENNSTFNLKRYWDGLFQKLQTNNIIMEDLRRYSLLACHIGLLEELNSCLQVLYVLHSFILVRFISVHTRTAVIYIFIMFNNSSWRHKYSERWINWDNTLHWICCQTIKVFTKSISILSTFNGCHEMQEEKKTPNKQKWFDIRVYQTSINRFVKTYINSNT